MHDSDESKPLVLRPRLTVHPELNPELYERLNSVRPELVNALIFQMLVKCSHFETYMNLGSFVPITHDISSKTHGVAQKVPNRGFKQPRTANRDQPAQQSQPEPFGHEITPSAQVAAEHDIDPLVLKDALNGICF